MFFCIMFVISMFMAGIIMDIGLTSIYAYFGWEFWPTFVVIGAIIGFIKAISDECWLLPSIVVFGFCGYVLAENWMLDGMIYALIISVVYCKIQEKFCNL